MKLRIFTAEFWRTVLGFNRPLSERSHDPLEPRHILRGQEEVRTIQSTDALPLQAEIPQDSAKEEKKLTASEPAERTEPIQPKEHLGQKTAEKFKAERPAKKPTEKNAESIIIGSELNLERNSVFTVSTYRGKSREITVRKDGPDGQVYESKVIIGKTMDGIENGVLTTNHFKVYLALLQLWEKAGRPIHEPVHFTILKIIKRLGLSHDGRTYARMKRWLFGLGQIPLTFINSFFAPEEGIHQTLDPLHILSYLTIYERKKVGRQQKTYGYGKFRFDDHILESLVNNHTHPLRLDVIRSFAKHKDLAILLYTYIDRNLAFKDKYEIGLEKLFEHLDLSQSYIPYPAKRKQRIDPVLEQLRGKELSTGVLSYAQIAKTKDGKDYKLVCRKKPLPKRLRGQEEPSQLELTLPAGTESESAKSSSELFPLLTEKGLTEKQVTKLVSEKSPEIISAQLDYLPFRLEEYRVQRKEINEAAILYDSISDNWKTPKSYLKAEKEKEQEARGLEREGIARLEQEERDREEQERAKIEAYKQSLGPEERAKLRERALEEIRGMQGVKEEFIGDILIGFKENETLKSEMEKEGN